MPEIEAYRQIVELQVEIVRLSQKNADLENQCKLIQAELISRHKKVRARAPALRVVRYVADRSVAVGENFIAAMQAQGFRPILRRISQSMI